MSYSVTNGYAPRDYETILNETVGRYNEVFGTSYTIGNFKGTNSWRFLYPIIQELMTLENNIALLSAKMQDYIRTQNEDLEQPHSTIDGFLELLERETGLKGSIKPNEEADAGHLFLCVDVDSTRADYATIKQKILQLEADNLAAGLVFEGNQTGTITAINGQQFNYGYSLPSTTALKVKVKITVSENTSLFVPTTQKEKEHFQANFAERYRLGYDFEPQLYLSVCDCPYASEVEVSYSTDGGVKYETAVLNGTYDEKFTIANNDLEVEIV